MNRNSKLKLFTQHSRSWRENRYVYPVVSRRSRGVSIGVNLNPDGVCNFDCVYCCVDRKSKRVVPPVDLKILERELKDMLSAVLDGSLFGGTPFQETPTALRRLNDIAFSGDGEPTAAFEFERAAQLAADAIGTRGLRDVKLVLITNSTLLHRPAVMRALEIFDRSNGEIWAKLDAGTEDYYRLIERTSIPLQRVLDNILLTGRKRPLVIQSMFLRFEGKLPSDLEIDTYGSRLLELLTQGCQIKAVHLYTVARAVADAGAMALTDLELNHLAGRLEQLKLPIETFYSPAAK